MTEDMKRYVTATADIQHKTKPDTTAHSDVARIPANSAILLCISWRNLSVYTVRSPAVIQESLLSQFHLRNITRKLGRRRPKDHRVLSKSSGCVRPGEILLVTGRSSPERTAVLTALTIQQSGHTRVEGTIRYGTMAKTECAQYFSSPHAPLDIDLLYSCLTVDQTLELAIRLAHGHRFIKCDKETMRQSKDWIVDELGLRCVQTRRVGSSGSELGISTRERKLLVIAEMMLVALQQPFLSLIDIDTGLDEVTATQCLKVIRSLTTRCQLSTIIALSGPIGARKELFDKVLDLDKGPVVCNVSIVASLPCSCGSAPLCENDLDNHEGPTLGSEEAKRSTAPFKDRFPHQSRAQGLDSLLDTIYRISIEIKFSFILKVQILWAERKSLAIEHASNLIQTLVAGSLFYDLPHDTSGLAKITGSLFFAMLFHSLVPLKHIPGCFNGRNIAAKYGRLSSCFVTADDIAFTILDMLTTICQVSIFAVVFYFLVGLRASAMAFFTFWTILITLVQSLTSIFRFTAYASGTIDTAFLTIGLICFATLVCCGYVVAETQMLSWYSWFFWINPAAMAYSALISNELGGSTLECVGPNLVPIGPTYIGNQVCIGLPGASETGVLLSGDKFLASQAYGAGQIWRNVGVLWAYWLFFGVGTTLLRMFQPPESNAGLLQVIRASRADDEESAGVFNQNGQSNSFELSKDNNPSSSHIGLKRDLQQRQQQRNPLFCWEDVSVWTEIDGVRACILDNTSGLLTRGSVTAIISPGCPTSTTLLRVLAQESLPSHQVSGVIKPEQEFTTSFTDCFKDPLDDHFITMREALLFSARFREGTSQPRSIKEELPDNRVKAVIAMLRLEDVADRCPGSGDKSLTTLQKRKMVLGEQLVVSPTVIFIRAPTTGLDYKESLEFMRALRQVATCDGTAICVSFEEKPTQELLDLADKMILLPLDRNQYQLAPGSESSSFPAETSSRLVAVHLPASSSEPAKHPISAWSMIRLATACAHRSMFHNIHYINRRIVLHIIHGLFNGFCFFHLPQTVQGIGLRQSTIFNFIFVATDVVAQQQSHFAARLLHHERSKASKNPYGTFAFACSLILPEIPYQVLCAVVYFVCWYYTVGLDGDAERTGAIFLTMLVYELLYTSAGQFIMACAPDLFTATALLNPLILGNFVAFSGILVPYAQLQTFWRSWAYWINPFTYFVGSMLNFSVAGMEVECDTVGDFVVLDPAHGLACGEYLQAYLDSEAGIGRRLLNPHAVAGCQICPYTTGTDWLRGKNLEGRAQGWSYIGITVAFVVFFYTATFVVMQIRARIQAKRLSIP